MRRDQAPQAGWYPDPTGGTRLWWWDGLDWTEHRRTSPPRDRPGLEQAAAAMEEAADAAGGDVGRRERAAAARSAARSVEQDTAEVVAQARRAARAEVDKAVREATSQLQDTRAQLLPRVEEWWGRLRRAGRWAAVALVLLVLVWWWVQMTTTMGLLEWVGDRFDAVVGAASTGGAVPLDAVVPGWLPRG